MEKIQIYTDGAARANGQLGNPAAWGAVLKYKENVKEISGFVRGATNNQMEMTAVIEALKAVNKPKFPIELYSDSAYVINCINQKWYKSWLNNGWLTSAKKPVENRELWIQILDQVERFPFLSFIKVKGHSGDPLNERADRLCNEAMDKATMKG